MSVNILLILKSNLIAIIAYLCICLILLMLRYAMMFFGILESLERMIGAGIFTLAFLFLCFLAGKLFISNSHNLLISVLSLLPLYIIIAVIVYISYGNPKSYGVLLAIPIHPISEIISYFFQIKIKYCYLLTSLLPSLSMWIGMLSKKA